MSAADLLPILAVLADGPLESGPVLDRIRDVAGEAAPSLPTFYRRLKAAVDEGWIEVLDDPPRPSGPGRPPRRFRLTESGRRTARTEARRWRAFTDLLEPGTGEAR